MTKTRNPEIKSIAKRSDWWKNNRKFSSEKQYRSFMKQVKEEYGDNVEMSPCGRGLYAFKKNEDRATAQLIFFPGFKKKATNHGIEILGVREDARADAQNAVNETEAFWARKVATEKKKAADEKGLAGMMSLAIAGDAVSDDGSTNVSIMPATPAMKPPPAACVAPRKKKKAVGPVDVAPNVITRVNALWKKEKATNNIAKVARHYKKNVRDAFDTTDARNGEGYDAAVMEYYLSKFCAEVVYQLHELEMEEMKEATNEETK